MSKVSKKIICSNCGEESVVEFEQKDRYVENKSKLRPTSTLEVFRITSDDIREYIKQKAETTVAGVSVEVVARYIPKRNANQQGYASLRIAFSDEALDMETSNSWYDRIGENPDVPMIKETLMKRIVYKFQYNKKAVDSWLKNYKVLETLERRFGLREADIVDIQRLCTPRYLKTADSKPWVVFAAAPENVIEDMLSPSDESKPKGTIQIVDVYQISKDLIEYLVYLHPTKVKFEQNLNVRKVLLGESKK